MKFLLLEQQYFVFIGVVQICIQIYVNKAAVLRNNFSIRINNWAVGVEESYFRVISDELKVDIGNGKKKK